MISDEVWDESASVAVTLFEVDPAIEEELLALLGGELPDLPEARCKNTDAEAWFAEQWRDEDNLTAKRICAGCPERLPCLQYAMDNDIEFGIWGGLTPGERQSLKEGQAA